MLRAMNAFCTMATCIVTWSFVVTIVEILMLNVDVCVCLNYTGVKTFCAKQFVHIFFSVH